MSKTTHCDICTDIIKTGDKKHLLAINPVTQTENDEMQMEDAKDFLQNYKKQFSKIQVLEICDICRNIITYLFKMRKEEREKIIKKMEAMYNKKIIIKEVEGNK